MYYYLFPPVKVGTDTHTRVDNCSIRNSRNGPLGPPFSFLSFVYSDHVRLSERHFFFLLLLLLLLFVPPLYLFPPLDGDLFTGLVQTFSSSSLMKVIYFEISWFGKM